MAGWTMGRSSSRDRHSLDNLNINMNNNLPPPKRSIIVRVRPDVLPRPRLDSLNAICIYEVHVGVVQAILGIRKLGFTSNFCHC